MTFDPDRVAAITFDSFTTLVDVRGSTRAALAEHVDDDVDSIARLWRSRAVDYRMVSTYVGEYATYEETTRGALAYALAAHGVDLPEDVVDSIADTFYELDVFGDVPGGMERLDDAGYDCYVVSNGNPALLDAVIGRAGIGEFVVDAISADEIRTYKPHPGIYEHAADRVGAPIGRIVHVTAPWYDVYGAKHAGMGTVWVNREGDPWEAFDGTPDERVADLDELAALFDA